jgi:hypothetical protein
MVCTIGHIQNACAIWDELVKKVCDHEQKKISDPTYLA